MISIKETIVVEGNYDKIKLSSFIDAVIFVTGGFSVISDENKIKTLVSLAEKNGIVILTDSDSAGFRIRNYIKQKISPDKVKHAYIPDVEGKEKRKRIPGREGLLGVEGMTEEIIINSLKAAGCEINGEGNTDIHHKFTKAELYFLGLSGSANSTEKRKKLGEKLGLPSKMSTNMLCDVLSRTMTYEELTKIIQEL